MVDLSLLAAAACFGAVTAVGAAVSMHEDIPGEPLGLRVPGRVPVHLAAGLGSGLSAPWPMPVATLLAGLLARPGAMWPGRVCGAVGSATIVGTLVEPVSWGRRSGSHLVKVSVALNLLAGTAMVLAGWRATARAEALGLRPLP